MTKRIPGLFDVMNRVAKGFEGFIDALRGYEIRTSAWVLRGDVVVITEPRRIHYMHPLTAITATNIGDPETELEETLAWIYERAHLELDQVLQHTDNRIKLAEIRQRTRMKTWMEANGVSQHDLEHARIQQWREETMTTSFPAVGSGS